MTFLRSIPSRWANPASSRARRPGSSRPAIAMIEAILATIIIGIMLVAGLRTVAATGAGRADITSRIIAANLASELMAEILSKPYENPDNPADTASRDTFTDVSSYHQYTESPPRDLDGTERKHLKGWTRSVEVTLVRRSDPMTEASSDRGVKRITVTVTRNDIPYARLTALRTRAAPR